MAEEIILHKENKVSAEYEAHDNIKYDIDENDLYQIDNMSFDEKRENIEWRKHEFESELENAYEIEIQNGMTCIYGNKVNKIFE